MRRALFALAFALPSPVLADGIAISMDEVRTVTFGGPIATVYVGNPAIADVNMIDARHAFVIGKGFGSTNIVALDGAGKEVSNTAVSVLSGSSNSAATVVLNRGTQRVTYNCTAARCEASGAPGDAKDAFDAINSQLAAHADIAHKAATGQ